MKNIFSKTKNKNSEKRGIIVTDLQNSDFWLIRDGWPSRSASALGRLTPHLIQPLGNPTLHSGEVLIMSYELFYYKEF